MNFQKLADTFKVEAGEHWTVGYIKTPTSDILTEADIEITELHSIENEGLYHIAKVFLKAVQKRGI